MSEMKKTYVKTTISSVQSSQISSQQTRSDIKTRSSEKSSMPIMSTAASNKEPAKTKQPREKETKLTKLETELTQTQRQLVTARSYIANLELKNKELENSNRLLKTKLLLTEDLANLEQNHTTQRPNRDQYLLPKEENTESTMKLWFYEQRLRQMENENVCINARLDKLEMLGSISQQNQNSTSNTRRRRNRNRTKKNVNGPSVYTENVVSDQSGSESISDNHQSSNTVDPSVRSSS